jgi:hypothetical protein
VEFDLTDEIKQLGVSKIFTTDSSIYVYNGKAFAQSAYYKKEVQKTLDKLKDKMLFCGHFGDIRAVEKIVILLSEIWVKSEETKAQAQSSTDKKKEKREFPIYKYSNRKKDALHEAVILGGKPVFLKYDSDAVEPIKTIGSIEEDSRLIRPQQTERYPYEPYEFENMNEVLSYVERARNETVDSLFSQAKRIATDYNDQKKDKVILLAIEIVWSYFQDKFPTTHYDIVLGGNGSGKSSFGITFGASGYRVVNLTSPNAANINRILGSIELGQCTIISDETGALDKNEDLMSLLKNGYDSKGKTSKINDFTREPEFFYAYCFKMIISERMPNLRNARGVLDRSFSFTTYKGLPKYDIKETLEPQGNPARQERLDILNDFRKLMLVYRLLHFKDPIPDISVGVEGREKELSKPIIQLFYGTAAQTEVETTLQSFLNLRNEKKEITLEPILHPIITNLISERSKQREEFGEPKNPNEIFVKEIWDSIKGTIQGYSDERRPHEYQTLEYGTIYNNTISNILEHTFGGRAKHRNNGNVFVFDLEELERVGKSYGVSTKIKTKIVTEEGSEGSEGSEGYTGEPPDPNKNKNTDSRGKSKDTTSKNRKKQGRGRSKSSSKQHKDTGAYPQKPSQPSRLHRHVIEEYSCRYCEFKTDIKTQYDHHTVLRHRGKAGY